MQHQSVIHLLQGHHDRDAEQQVGSCMRLLEGNVPGIKMKIAYYATHVT